MKRHFQCGDDPSMIRPWSEHDPTMIRPWKRKPQPASQVRLLFQLTTSIFYCKIQRFAPNLTFKPSPNTAPTTKRYTWPSPRAAPATKSDTWGSPSTAPATQNDSHAWSSSHMKPHFQCAEQQVSPSNLTKYCACHTEWLACLIVVTYETSFTMRGATGVTIQPHQILRLLRKMTRLLYHPHIWNVISNARSNRCHYPTSPNSAPATKNDTARFQRKSLKTGETSFPMRGRSEHDPTMIRAWSDHENANRNPPRKWGYFSSSPRAFSIVKYNVSRPILHSNLHQILRLPQKDTLDLHQVLHLPRKVTLEVHQVLRLPHKMTRMLDRRHIWNLISNARSNRCHHPTSPNTAPATQNDSHAWSSSHMKRHLQCAEQQVSPSNLTKYCACYEKWLDCFIILTYETSFPMRGATGVTIQPHQIVRLPRKMTLQDFKENL